MAIFYAVNITNSVQNDWWYYPLAILSIKSEYDTTPRGKITENGGIPT